MGGGGRWAAAGSGHTAVACRAIWLPAGTHHGSLTSSGATALAQKAERRERSTWLCSPGLPHASCALNWMPAIESRNTSTRRKCWQRWQSIGATQEGGSHGAAPLRHEVRAFPAGWGTGPALQVRSAGLVIMLEGAKTCSMSAGDGGGGGAGLARAGPARAAGHHCASCHHGGRAICPASVRLFPCPLLRWFGPAREPETAANWFLWTGRSHLQRHGQVALPAQQDNQQIIRRRWQGFPHSGDRGLGPVAVAARPPPWDSVRPRSRDVLKVSCPAAALASAAVPPRGCRRRPPPPPPFGPRAIIAPR